MTFAALLALLLTAFGVIARLLFKLGEIQEARRHEQNERQRVEQTNRAIDEAHETVDSADDAAALEWLRRQRDKDRSS